MTRIILVGNGFDLAHGMRTSYKDFINYYLGNVFQSFFKNNYSYHDPLIKIERNLNVYPENIPRVNTDDYIQFLNEFTREYTRLFNISIGNLLNETRFHLEEMNWVDIEMEYFKCLRKCIVDHIPNRALIQNINAELDFIRTELEKYLTKIQDEHIDFLPDPDMLSIFQLPINWHEVSLTAKPEEIRGRHVDGNPFIEGLTSARKTLVVNFNYTNTAEKYVNHLYTLDSEFDINYIHGRINSLENPPVFGFGDEYDKEYTGFEDYNENSLFTHVKSFRYFLTKNNKNLLHLLG